MLESYLEYEGRCQQYINWLDVEFPGKSKRLLINMYFVLNPLTLFVESIRSIYQHREPAGHPNLTRRIF